MAFNSRQYEWADVTVLVGGKDMLTIQSVKYDDKVEREAVYGKGRNPISIQTGNRSVEGEIGILQSELIDLEDASNGSILSLAVDIEVSYAANGVIRTDRIEGVRFTEHNKEFNQNDKHMEVTIPFIAVNVEHGK